MDLGIGRVVYQSFTRLSKGEFEGNLSLDHLIEATSSPVASCDLQPEMNSIALTGKLVQAIDGGSFDLILCNYANGEMVGHTENSTQP